MSTTGTAPSSSPPSPANDDVPAVSRQLTTPTKDMSALDAPVLPAVHDRPPGTGATASSTGTTSSTGTGTTSTATNTSPMVDLSKTRPATNGNGSDHPTVDVRSIPSTACSSPQHKPSLVGNDGDASNVDRIVELSPNSRYAKVQSQ